MSTTYEVTVWCDTEGCNAWQQDALNGARGGGSVSGVRLFRRQLARRGWSRRHRDGRVVDLCPDCTKLNQEGEGAQELPFGVTDAE